jgi:maleate isomerase
MTRVGILTPASNSNLEPITAAMLAGLANVSVHFSRFRLPPSLEAPIAFDDLAPAAELLVEAGVELLVLHGTAGSWTGPDGDRALCRTLEDRFGSPATTATLAVLDALGSLGVARYGLVFPGPAEIAEEIARRYEVEGFVCGRIAAGELSDNRSIGSLEPGRVAALVEEAHDDTLDAVVIVGTNTPSAPLVEGLEARLPGLVVDSTGATTWQFLRLVGWGEPLAGWGKLLARTR